MDISATGAAGILLALLLGVAGLLFRLYDRPRYPGDGESDTLDQYPPGAEPYSSERGQGNVDTDCSDSGDADD